MSVYLLPCRVLRHIPMHIYLLSRATSTYLQKFNVACTYPQSGRVLLQSGRLLVTN